MGNRDCDYWGKDEGRWQVKREDGEVHEARGIDWICLVGFMSKK